MIGLDRLMNIPGVVAAGQCDSEGKIIRKVGVIPDKIRDQIAKINVEQTKSLEAATLALEEMTDMEWTPMVGWMMWGGKYALCIVHNNCLIIEASLADFNQLMVDMFESEPSGGNPQLSGL